MQKIAKEIYDLYADGCKYYKDPYKWVLWAFPWGEGELKDYDGPDEWQADILKAIRDGLSPAMALQIAVASGHDIGKSALVAWITLWGITTREDTRGIVTANTEVQLRTKTWAEVAKWYRLYICKELFVYTATALYANLAGHDKTWRCDCVPWSETNPESFAGLHNHGKRIFILFDEASAIADAIWTVAEGATMDSDTEIIWCAFGNPTRNTGAFRECFRKNRAMWVTRNIDARTCKFANKVRQEQLIESYGIGSDYVKIRILGQFPSQSDRQFISQDIVEAARHRDVLKGSYEFAPKILTCDPAWTGGDEIVIGFRQGIWYRKLAVYQRNDNDMEIAGYLAEFEDAHEADAVLVDMGYGTGIVSAGKAMNRRWTLVSFAGASPDPGYLNLRAYGWAQGKKWMQEGGVIDDDQVLADDLTAPEYTVRLDGKIVLESKADMKARGIPSPNRADALMLSFMVPVVSKHHNPRHTVVKKKFDAMRGR